MVIGVPNNMVVGNRYGSSPLASGSSLKSAERLASIPLLGQTSRPTGGAKPTVMLRNETHIPSYRNVGGLSVTADKSNNGSGRKPSSRRPDTILIERGKLQIHIPVQNILFVKSEHIYCRIFFSNNQQILQRMSLEKLLERLPAGQFLRVHRSFLVNVNHVQDFNTTKIIIGEAVIPIGRTWRAEVVRRLKALKR